MPAPSLPTSAPPATGRSRFHPRCCAGRPRAVRWADGEIEIMPCTTTVLLHRRRSPRKPGPFPCDVSIPEPGEVVERPTLRGRLGQVLA